MTAATTFREPAALAAPTTRTIIAVGVGVYVATQAFDSALRWMLEFGGAGAAIYGRDAIVLLCVLLCVHEIARERRDIVGSVVVFWILAALACISLLSGLGIAQTLFGVKVWLPLVLGFLLVEAKVVPHLNHPKTWFLLWAVVCAGVLVNYFDRLPWAGLTVQVGDVAISGNREWTAAGVKRLSGFSRTSFDAAIIVLLLHLYLVCVWRSLFVRTVLTLVSGLVIALTTAKGAAGAFVLVTACLPFLGFARRTDSAWRVLFLAALVVLAAIGLVFPLVSLQIPLPRLPEGSPEHWLLSSIVSRAWDTWPRALRLLEDWQAVTGRGLGGIGAAQYAFEPGRANPADSFFVYVYVTGGILGAWFYLALLYASRKLQLQRVEHQIAYLVLLCLFAYGLTINVIESAVFAIVIGMVSGLLMRRSREEHEISK